MSSLRRMFFMEEEAKAKPTIKQETSSSIERFNSISFINKMSQHAFEKNDSKAPETTPQLTKFKSFSNHGNNKSFHQFSKESQSYSRNGKSEQTIGRMKSYGAIPLSKKKLNKTHVKQTIQVSQPIIKNKQDQVQSPALDVFKAIVFYNEQLAKNAQNTNNSQKLKKTLKFKKKEEIGYMSSEISLCNNQSLQQKKNYQYMQCQSQRIIQSINDRINERKFEKNQFFTLFQSFCPKNQQQPHYSSLGGDRLKKMGLTLKNITENSRDHETDTKLNKSNSQNCIHCGSAKKESIQRQKVIKFCDQMQKIHNNLKKMSKMILTEFKKFRKQCELQIMKILQKMPDVYERQINMYQTQPAKKTEGSALQSSLVQHALSQGSQIAFAKTKSQVEVQITNEKTNDNNKLLKDQHSKIKQKKASSSANIEEIITQHKNGENKKIQTPSPIKDIQIQSQVNLNPSFEGHNNISYQTFQSQKTPRLTGRIIKNIPQQKQQQPNRKKLPPRIHIPRIDLPITNGILNGLDFDDPMFTEQNYKFNGQMVSSKNPRSPPTKEIVINTERVGKIFKNFPNNQISSRISSNYHSFATHRGTRSLHGSGVSAGSRDDYKSCYTNIKEALSRLKEII